MSASEYKNLLDLSSELALLHDAAATLSWDQETMLPPNGVAYRARQMAWMSGEMHKRFTADQVGKWIDACEPNGEAQAANLREWRHQYQRATKLPLELVTDFEETRSLAKSSWAEARAESDFSVFAPVLEKLIDLCQRRAECWGYEDRPYDALLDEFERGARSVELEKLFGSLKGDLVEIANAALQRPAPTPLPPGPYPVAAQQAFNHEVAEWMGFDFDAGRIDTAVHPFCSGMGVGDVRLTTRYDDEDFLSSLFGVMHEAGHGTYEQGLAEDEHGQPIGTSVSLGIHESQSRLWENHVGRSREFWEHWLPRAIVHFPQLVGVDVDTMFAHVNRAERSFIRVEADEVTYDLHILLRFEIEQAIFSGDLAIADIPAAWNEAFEKLLGLKVDKDANGCLQDIHWSLGIFGYFPTYSLGNLNASHLYASALQQQPAIKTQLAAGDCSGLLAWMREKIHRPGSRYLPGELIERATGSATDPSAHLQHLRTRYLGQNS